MTISGLVLQCSDWWKIIMGCQAAKQSGFRMAVSIWANFHLRKGSGKGLSKAFGEGSDQGSGMGMGKSLGKGSD